MIELRTLPLFDERGGAFAQLRDRRVLVYFPHGLGDFVHFGYVVPALEPSNRYAISRFGDDFVHLYDGARGIEPLYCGTMTIGDGAAQGSRHLGVEWKKIRNRPAEIAFPQPLAARVREAGIDTVLYTDYPEPEGRNAFPFHTKARTLLRGLVSRERLAALELGKPLPTALTFEVPRPSRERIETRLRDLTGEGTHLYLLAPGGHTTPGKTWPRDRVEALLEALPRFDPNARALLIDEPTLRSSFGDLELPFAHLLATLLRRSHATIGVSAGPLHAAMAMRASPVVGIWLAHHPDWYDEFNPDSLHLTGPLIARKRLGERASTTTTPPALRAKTIAYADRVPDANDVLGALESLLR